MSEWNPHLPKVELPIPKKRKRKKKRKQKKERRIKRKFKQTTLGNSLRLNAPLEYNLILEVSGGHPDPNLIEAVSYSSINPYFKGVSFRKHLIKYRNNGGCYQSIPEQEPDAEKIRRYAEIRKNRFLE